MATLALFRSFLPLCGHISSLPKIIPNNLKDDALFHANRAIALMSTLCIIPATAFAASKEIVSGKASYYSSGTRTANGEHFNPNGYTAAHRTLPFGTKLRVTNRDNGRSVIVRVNDRGPFVHSRILDLSRGAAKAIGMIGAGTARIQKRTFPSSPVTNSTWG